MTAPEFVSRRRIRYSEVDTQKVVFNAHYLTFCDDALDEYLEAIGLSYEDLMSQGYDMQVVGATISWKASYEVRDTADIRVVCQRIGTTSVVLDFTMTEGEREIATVSLTYVIIRTDGSGKAAVPDWVRHILLGEEPAVQA